MRKALHYPPYGKLIRFKLIGKNLREVEEVAHRLVKALAPRLPERTMVLGPAPAYPAIVARQHRWHLVIKGPAKADMREATRLALAHLAQGGHTSRVRITADVDPLNVMS